MGLGKNTSRRRRAAISAWRTRPEIAAGYFGSGPEQKRPGLPKIASARCCRRLRFTELNTGSDLPVKPARCVTATSTVLQQDLIMIRSAPI